MKAHTPTEHLVLECHTAFGVAVESVPYIYDRKINTLRIALIQEELNELKEALGEPVTWWQRFKKWLGFQTMPVNETEVFDALCDIQYVLDGTFVSLGFWLWKLDGVKEVHRANMSKLGADGKPIFRADGKYLKGPNYTPPNLSKVLLASPTKYSMNVANVEYQSLVSGLWYNSHRAAGTCKAVRIDGEYYELAEVKSAGPVAVLKFNKQRPCVEGTYFCRWEADGYAVHTIEVGYGLAMTPGLSVYVEGHWVPLDAWRKDDATLEWAATV